MTDAELKKIEQLSQRSPGWWFVEHSEQARIALPKLLAEIDRLRKDQAEAYCLIDQLDALAVEGYPALYERAQRWKKGKRP